MSPMTRSLAAIPEDAYLVRVGELAYTVASLEWTILGDLGRLSSDLPDELTLAVLEPLETGGIAAKTKQAAKALPPGPVKDYLDAAYPALFKAAAIRSDVLHARPATHPSLGQRLYRAEIRDRQTTGHRFWIDDEWLTKAAADLNEALSNVNRVRPPLM